MAHSLNPKNDVLILRIHAATTRVPLPFASRKYPRLRDHHTRSSGFYSQLECWWGESERVYRTSNCGTALLLLVYSRRYPKRAAARSPRDRVSKRSMGSRWLAGASGWIAVLGKCRDYSSARSAGTTQWLLSSN